jgi:predicted metal-dependent peptidase
MEPTNNGSGPMNIGIQRLLSKYPLLGGIVASWEIRPDRAVATMAIGQGKFSPELTFNPDFVNGISPDELVGVLHHEVRHMVYGHLFMAPEDFPDEAALCTAQEITVNENMPEPLPGCPITLADYPRLPKNEDTEQRYRRLKGRKLKQGAVRVGLQAPQPGKGPGTPPNGQAGPDDHSRWGELRNEAAAVKAQLLAAAAQAAADLREPTAEEQALIERIERLCGSQPGKIISELSCGAHGGSVNWRTLLRRYVGAELEPEYSYFFPSRRFPELTGIVPGKKRSPQKPRIMAVIDTSGSMTDEILAEVSKELTRLARTSVVHVVECDAEIQRTYRYTKPIKKVSGRGGTSFIPPFKNKCLHKIKPDLAIYFTDGCGPAPDKAPEVPVIWVLTPDGTRPAQWGRTVNMA